MDYKTIAKAGYKKFAFVEGNQYIASEYALIKILELVKDFKVKSILEVGLGIGSISDTIFHYARQNGLDIQYTGTEANDYCLDALPKNVVDYHKIELYNEMSQIKQGSTFDLIIVDGSDDSFQKIAGYCKADTVIFIEGYRGVQIVQFMKIFPNSLRAETISPSKNPAYGPFPADRWGGGGQLIFTNPGLYQKWYWLIEKGNSFIKNRMRKFKG
ncbi:hypothetical protein [Flavobacterium sp.]|uniref:hypothetical protein n=1 Tax=Flavobacterium sp. TaxID=239 RepID=UPI0039E4CA6E